MKSLVNYRLLFIIILVPVVCVYNKSFMHNRHVLPYVEIDNIVGYSTYGVIKATSTLRRIN